MATNLIKVYHNFQKGKGSFVDFLEDVSKTMKGRRITFGLHRIKGETKFSVDTSDAGYPLFETQFYTHFNDFQIVPDTKKEIWEYKKSHSVLGEIKLVHKRFFPFGINETDDSDFIFNLFRTFENLDIIKDKMSLFVQIKPIVGESIGFAFQSKLKYRWFKRQLGFRFYKYIFNNKTKKNRKSEGDKFFKQKLQEELFEVKIYILAESDTKASATGKVEALFNNFMVFKNYPLNEFKLKIHPVSDQRSLKKPTQLETNVMSTKEIATFFHFPKKPQSESSLLTVKSKKLPLPVGIPTFEYTTDKRGEVFAKNFPDEVNIVGTSDYRSITVPVGIYDEDRLRHVYIVGKTGTGKSKFMQGLMVNDVHQKRGICVIDPHGDAIGEIMMRIPKERKDDVIIFDPADEKFPFCLNPLDVKENESKQVLAKGFIDIFKKFFGANWNPKLEHVLRMIFLALLDKKDATLFDIIRALTDKDFRYDMIDQIEDDVVRNFWTNEFAGRSQQFNTEAIMPILNKVGQLLSIDVLKNIFASSENKLDFREVMDSGKILLVKLPKGKLQEEIMGFLGAMFVTKLYQTAMGRQNIAHSQRRPFFLYIDEFQNFATETFNEILSEARKYGLSLCVAHQFVKQIPDNISDALFGNVGTMISFRVSSDDAEFIKNHYAPFLGGYDLANLNMREFYCKTLIKGQVKDPFSLRSAYMPDVDVEPKYVDELYKLSRAKYSRTLEEAKKVVQEETKDVQKVIEEFGSPII